MAHALPSLFNWLHVLLSCWLDKAKCHGNFCLKHLGPCHLSCQKKASTIPCFMGCEDRENVLELDNAEPWAFRISMVNLITCSILSSSSITTLTNWFFFLHSVSLGLLALIFFPKIGIRDQRATILVCFQSTICHRRCQGFLLS